MIKLLKNLLQYKIMFKLSKNIKIIFATIGILLIGAFLLSIKKDAIELDNILGNAAFTGPTLLKVSSSSITPLDNFDFYFGNQTASAGADFSIDAVNQTLQFGQFLNCNLDTDGSGFLVCGTDASGGGGGVLWELQEGSTDLGNISSLSFDAGGFIASVNGTVGTVRIDYSNGPASRSANETITGTWTFNNAPILPAGSKFVTSNSLDFDEFVNAMTLDVATTIASSGLTFDFGGTDLVTAEFSAYASLGALFGTAFASDCDSAGSQLLWDMTTGKFTCESLADADIPDTITASNYVRTSTWTDHNNYPTGCTNQFVTDIGDTLTCASVDISDTTNLTAGTDLTLTGDDLSLDSTLTQNFNFSGALITFSNSASVSGDFEVVGYASSSKLFGAGLGNMSGTDGCSGGDDTLNYTASTGLFSCGSDASGGGGGTQIELSESLTQDSGTKVSSISFAPAHFDVTFPVGGLIKLDWGVGGAASLSQAETITGNWVNTDNPWADNEIVDTLTISGGTIGSNTLSAGTTFTGSASISANLEIIGYASASAYFGSAFSGDCDSAGSQLLWDTTTGTFSCETLADADIPDDITINGTNTVTWASLTSYPTGCTNQAVITIGDTLTCASINNDWWSGTDLSVANGGTGASSLADGGVLVGSGTGAITALTVGTNGQLLMGSTGADPVFATLTCDTGLTCTTGAGTLEIDVDDSYLLIAGDIATGLIQFSAGASGTNSEWTGYASASQYFGSAFSGDCDNGTNDKLLWDTTTGTFSCGVDQTAAGSGVSSNSLDFDEFVNAFTLDANVTFASGAFNWQWGSVNQTSTGVIDYGGAKSLELPNGTAPTVDAVGECAFDTTDGVFICYDGTNTAVYGDDIDQMTFVIYDDGDWDSEAVPIWNAPLDMDITIIQVSVATLNSGTASLSYNIEERAFGSINSAGTDIYSSDQYADNTGEDETSFSNSGIAAKAHLVFTTPVSAETGTVDAVTGVIYYRRNVE